MTAAEPTRYAVIYARVSTEDQGKGFSIPTQIEACQKLAEREWYTVPESHILVDEGISGTTMDRPGLRALRDLVNAKTITVVVVHDPDRLSRNLGHQLLLAEEMERASVKLLIVSHPMEQGPEGWLFFQMRGALAEYERAKLIERTERGRVGRAKAGCVSGGGVPYGYRYIAGAHQGCWEIDEEEAAVVRRVFDLFLKGATIRAIALQLTQERIPTAKDRPHHTAGHKRTGLGVWATSTVHDILNKSAYVGRAYINKRRFQCVDGQRRIARRRAMDEWIEVPVPAIIDEGTLEAARHQLERNRQLSARRMKRSYLLRGRWFKCGRCGSAMVGFTSHGTYGYYRCTTATDKLLQEERCRGGIRADVAESQVWGTVMRILDQPELIRQEVARQYAQIDDQQQSIAAERETIQRAIVKCEEAEARWRDAYSDGAIALAEFKAYRGDVLQRKARLQAQFQELTTKEQSLQEHITHAEALIDYCQRVRNELQTFSQEEKQRAFDALAIRTTFIQGAPLHIEARIPVVTESDAPK
jgi:site-specific DNA recombinase